MTSRVEELLSSLSKYAHLLGFPVNMEWVRVVEEIQVRIMDEVRLEAQGYESLREFITALDSRGYISRIAGEIAGIIGEDMGDYEGAFRAALSGDLSVKGAKAVLIALQAIARAYAEELQRRGVAIETSASCPVCGAISETMFKEGGRYYMVCHFCSYTWLVSEGKPICPYCGNQDGLTISVISDRQMRVALMKCWECGSTWRVIMDETIRAPPILKPLIAMAAEKLRAALREIERMRGEV